MNGWAHDPRVRAVTVNCDGRPTVEERSSGSATAGWRLKVFERLITLHKWSAARILWKVLTSSVYNVTLISESEKAAYQNMFKPGNAAKDT